MDYGRAVRTKYDEKRNSYHQEEREAMELDIFLRDENIRRYRRLLDSSTGKTERGTIFKLLAEEMEKIKGEHLQKTGKSNALKQIVAVSCSHLPD